MGEDPLRKSYVMILPVKYVDQTVLYPELAILSSDTQISIWTQKYWACALNLDTGMQKSHWKE